MKKKCSACGIEFEPQGAFCPFCGQALDNKDSAQDETTNYTSSVDDDTQSAGEDSSSPAETIAGNSNAALENNDTPTATDIDEQSNITDNAKTNNAEDIQDKPVEAIEIPESPETVEDDSSASKPSRRKIGIIVGSVAVALVAIALIIFFITRPQPLPLNETITVSGMQVSYPSAWEISKSESDDVLDLTYINLNPAASSDGFVVLGATTADTASLKKSIDAYFDDYLQAVGDTQRNVEKIELDGQPGRKLEIDKEANGRTYTGYCLVVSIGDRIVYCWTLVPKGSEESLNLTMKNLVDSAHINAPEATVTFITDQGKTIQEDTVYDFGGGASIAVPSVDGSDGRIITSWKVKEGNATISAKEDGSNLVSGITGDVTVEAATVEGKTVTFTDGNGKNLSSVLVEPGKGATAPKDPTRSGYTFTGWDADYSNVTENITVNATWKELPKKYSSGTYRVGTDIPADEYAITSSGSCYWCVYSDTTKHDIVANDNFEGRAYVTVYDGQLLEVNRGSFISSSGCTPNNKIGTSAGTFKVGFDIPAGTYKLNQSKSSSSMAYYAVYNSSDAGARIVENDNFNGQNYVTVSEGQYLILSRCTGELS